MDTATLAVFCEYLTNPVGLDTPAPRFSWSCATAVGASGQTGYRIKVAKTAADLAAPRSLVWDSGHVVSAASVNIPYGGDRLETGNTYFYAVTLVLDNGDTMESPVQTFTMGLADGEPWRAMWIGGPAVEKHTFWYRRELALAERPRKALAFVASPNYHILSVNGAPVGDAVLDTAWTDCAKTVLYATHDITDSLVRGDNVLGLAVGNGWHNLRLSEDGVGGGENMFSLQLLLIGEDGASRWILSDLGDWLFTTDGPIVYNGIYNGETYDARLEMDGWDRPGGLAGLPERVRWAEPVEHEPPGGNYKAQTLEPIKVVGHIRPVAIHAVGDGSYGVDFGQNFAGWARLRVRGKAGDTITMKFAELENADHSVNQGNLRLARATDSYTLKGGGEEVHEPRFTYHGFRYMQVFGLSAEPGPETFTGCVVRSAVRQIGSFHCDQEVVNKLYQNILWTEGSNLHGLPTDCPQRDERLGWLNDMTVRNECALYNFRLPQLYAKWLGDIRDAQGVRTGAVTDTAPFRRYGLRPADPVSSSFLLVPWNLYLHYGDKRVIEENYDAMKRWVGYLKRNSTGYVVKYSQMGDWAGPIFGTDPGSIGAGAVSAITPTRFVGTCYFHYNCELLAKMAAVLGRDEDAARYRAEAVRIRDAIYGKYFDANRKCFATNSQASNTLPLYLGLVEPGDREGVLANLVSDIVDAHGTSLTTGNLCTRYIVEVLLENGREDVAFDLLTRTEYPSWGYMIANQATTVWERWEHITEGPLLYMASHNHPMNGSVGVCFHKHLAGIRPDETRPGFARVVVKPRVPSRMRHASAGIETIRGKVRSAWNVLDDGSFSLEVEIPFNSDAAVHLPLRGADAGRVGIAMNGAAVPAGDIAARATADGYVMLEVPSGVHRFVVKPLS